MKRLTPLASKYVFVVDTLQLAITDLVMDPMSNSFMRWEFDHSRVLLGVADE